MTDRTASQDHPDSSQQVFRFLDLAAEIRNEIYSFVVVGENRVYDLAVFIPPAIARASTQLRSESLPIIFADAEFYVNVVSNVHEITRRRRPHRPPIRRLMDPRRCGTFEIVWLTAKILQKAENDVIFKNMSFRMFQQGRGYAGPRQYSRGPPQPCISILSIRSISAGRSIKVVNGPNHPESHLDRDRQYLGNAVRVAQTQQSIFGGRVSTMGEALDIKDFTDRAQATAREIAAREGFVGYTLADAEAIGRCFCASVPVEQGTASRG